MADPYAERESAPAPERPAAGSALAALVTGREGLPASSCAELADAGSARFVAVLLRDEGIVPPLARLRPEQAPMLLAATAGNATELDRALAAQREAPRRPLLLKEGLIAGPAGRTGAFTVDAAAAAQLLDACLEESIEWETDPDFGYEVPARVPGFEAEAALALCPRLLYAEHDRAYEHADLVTEVKRLRHRRVAAIDGVDRELLSATGWPIEPTGSEWKD